MSNLLHAAVKNSLNIFKINSHRQLQQRIKDAFIVKFRSSEILCFTTRTPKNGQRANFCTRAYDVNTNISKDCILFKYENPKFYKMLNIFSICQFVFWTYLSHFSFTTLKDAPVPQDSDTELAWYQRINLGENKYRNTITVFCFAIGYGILAASWLFTLRSVRYLILRKGGKEVSFVTYGPFDKNRIMTVPLNAVSAQESRNIARVQLPIKVKNRALYYVLDMRGEFKNPQLFDYTAGLKRRFVE